MTHDIVTLIIWIALISGIGGVTAIGLKAKARIEIEKQKTEQLKETTQQVKIYEHHDLVREHRQRMELDKAQILKELDE